MEKRIERLQQLEAQLQAHRLARVGFLDALLGGKRQAQGRRARPAVRDDDGPGHARHRARHEAQRRRPGSSSSRSTPPTSTRSSRTPRSCCAAPPRRRGTQARVGRRRVRLPLDRSCATPTSRTSWSRSTRSRPSSRAAATATACWPRCSPSRRRASAIYFIYNFKRGAFYPFVPAPGDKQRDTERELRLKAQLGAELPFEEEIDALVPAVGDPALGRPRFVSWPACLSTSGRNRTRSHRTR